MKRTLLLLSAALLGARLIAQTPPPPAEIGAPRLNAQDLEVLVTPIALYPDPLVALILPASTNPSDVVLAARFLERGGTPETASSERWDESVKSLTRYREVINYLNENLEWTQSLGQAFTIQPDDVMGAIQAVRSRARSSGLLTSNAQQEVIVEETIIEIVPAQPTVIYVPRYDPEILYVSRPSYFHSSFVSFGVGYHVGAWLNFDCDWRHRSIHTVHRPHTWYHQPDWRHRHVHHRSHNHNHVWTRWNPSHRHHRHDGYANRPQRPVHSVMPGRSRHWSNDDRRDVQPAIAATGDGLASAFQGTPQPGPDFAGSVPREDRQRNGNSNFDRRRHDDRNRRPAGTTNTFAATPTLTESAPVANAPAQPRYERRQPGYTRPQPSGDRAPNAQRPDYRANRPQVASQPPPQGNRPNYERRQHTPAPQPVVSAPPPQRPVQHVARPSPPPRANSDSPRSQQSNPDRGNRSDSLERAGRVQHAY